MSPLRRGALALLAMILVAACGGAFEPPPSERVEALPSSTPEPADNVASPPKVDLGRLLFWDPLLSGDRDVACATCHHPDFAYADGIVLSVGAGGVGLGPGRVASPTAPHRTRRNAMTVLDVAWNGLGVRDPFAGPEQAPMFWDSRALSLEAQAKGPILSADEMRGDHFEDDAIFPEIVARLSGVPEYVALFEAAFGAGSIDEDNIARAIAAFERTLVARGSSFDRFLRGDDRALNFEQKRGLFAFISAGCAKCHSGPMVSDFRLHRLGVPDLDGAPHDEGDGSGRFRTPSLRNVMRTAPYMHNGRFRTIDDVLDDFYFHVDRSLDPDLDELDGPNGKDGSTISDIKAFLWSMSDGTFDCTVPARVPSGLEPGGRIHERPE